MKRDKTYRYDSLTQGHVLQRDALSESVFNNPGLLLAYSSHGKDAAFKQEPSHSDSPQHATLKTSEWRMVLVG